jgi:hypothetical protein
MEDKIAEIRALFADDHLIDAFRKIREAEQDPELAKILETMPEVPLIKDEVAVVENIL